jgi:hypothetical protein
MAYGKGLVFFKDTATKNAEDWMYIVIIIF